MRGAGFICTEQRGPDYLRDRRVLFSVCKCACLRRSEAARKRNLRTVGALLASPERHTRYPRRITSVGGKHVVDRVRCCRADTWKRPPLARYSGGPRQSVRKHRLDRRIESQRRGALDQHSWQRVSDRSSLVIDPIGCSRRRSIIVPAFAILTPLAASVLAFAMFAALSAGATGPGASTAAGALRRPR